jgi:hypothetical protein
MADLTSDAANPRPAATRTESRVLTGYRKTAECGAPRLGGPLNV